MSDPNTLGSVVRRRRLESGYSLGQLASKVGKTAAEVRAWERDAELPEHGILERLAETLELDVADIRAKVEAAQESAASEAALEEVEEEPQQAEVEEEPQQAEVEEEPQEAEVEEEPQQAEVEEEPQDAEVEEEPQEAELKERSRLEEGQDEDDAPVAIIDADAPVDPEEEDSDTAAKDEADAGDEADSEDDLPGFPVEDPFAPPEPDTESDPDKALLDAPTEAVPVPVITDTARTARAQRAAAVLEETPPLPIVEPAPDADPGLLRYLEPLRLLFDPHSRYLYWIRAGLTVIVMLILVVILFRMLGSLLDAVGELLDTIEPAATDPDDLDALSTTMGLLG